MTAAITRPIIVDEPGVYDDMPETVYHSDPVPAGSLSHSGAKRLLETCPAKFHYERQHGRPPKDVFEFGHVAHHKILGRGLEIVEVDADNWLTKDARQERVNARAAGKVAALKKDVAKGDRMAEAVRKHPFAAALLRDGQAETSMFWVDETTGVWLRGRADWLTERPGRLLIVDYKTCDDASDEACAKSIWRYGYTQQADWYPTGAAALDLGPSPTMIFIFQEKTAPYLVNVAACDETMLAYGHAKNAEALAIYQRCTADGRWPGYGETDITYASLPGWVERRFLEGLL